jgi:hypothetical protein
VAVVGHLGRHLHILELAEEDQDRVVQCPVLSRVGGVAVAVEVLVGMTDGELDLGDPRAGGAQHLAQLRLGPDRSEDPVLAPITATGLLRSRLVASGRDTQSMAFFRTPGIDELYSGVANRTASALEIARLRSATAAGPSPISSSSQYGGIALRPPKTSNSPPC